MSFRVQKNVNTYLITPKSKSEQDQLAQFLERSHLSARVLSDEDKEDLAMLRLMAEGDPSETASEEEVMRVLRPREG